MPRAVEIGVDAGELGEGGHGAWTLPGRPAPLGVDRVQRGEVSLRRSSHLAEQVGQCSNWIRLNGSMWSR